MPKHEKMGNAEVEATEEAARLEALTLEAQRLAKASGLTVEQWLAQATPEDREKYKHVPGVLAIWERVDRETRERNAQYRPTGPGPSTVELACSPDGKSTTTGTPTATS